MIVDLKRHTVKIITIQEYQETQLLVPGLTGDGSFMKDGNLVTDDEFTHQKALDDAYVSENGYTHIAWDSYI